MFYLRIFGVLYIILVTQTGILWTQDVHFSQIQNLPLLVNPAQSGFYSDYDYRVNAVYRLQKTPVGSAYNTFVAWADVRMQPLYNQGWFGLGLSAIRDNTSGSILTLNKYILTVAYHQVINDDMIVSLGLGGSYTDRHLDRSKIIFGDQFDGSNFSRDLPTADVFLSPTSRFWALTPAINLAYTLEDNSQLLLGFSMDNVNRPSTSFIQGDARKSSELRVNQKGQYTVPLRYHTNLSYIRQIADNMTWSIYTYFTYQNQARQNLIGTELAYDYIFAGRKVLSLSGGLMYRVNRSGSLLLGLETRHLKLGIGYDLAITKTSFFFDNYSSFECSCTFRSVFPQSNRARNKLKRKIRCVNNFGD